MRRVVQRRLGVLAALALLGVGFAAFRLMSEPTRPASDDAGGTPRAEWQPPPLVAAESAAPTVEAVEIARPVPRPIAIEPAVRDPGPRRLHVRGRLVGIVPSSPWKAPIYVLSRIEPDAAWPFRRSSIVVRTPKRRREEFESFMDPRLAQLPTELVKPWDPVTEPTPPLERLELVDSVGQRVPVPSSPVAEDGTFDVTLDRDALASGYPREAALGSGRARATGLDLVANDPAYMPVVRSLDLSRVKAHECEDVEWTIDVVPAGRVTGLVDAHERGPTAARGGLGAVAALFEGTLDDTSGAPVDVGVADDRYVLRAPTSGSYTLVLAARDLAPIQMPVQIVVGAELEAPTATFDGGASIRGTVRWPPLDRVALAYQRTGAAVTAIALTRGKALDLPGHPLVYANGKLERRSVTVTTANATRGAATFRVDGLEDGHAYRLLLGDPSLAGAAGSPVEQPPVVAPARDIELSFDLAWLNVMVLCGGQPVHDARVSVSSLAPDPQEQRRSSFFLPPFHEGELLVEAEGFEPAREHFTMGPAGTTTTALAVLVRKAVHAKLDLFVDCDPFETVDYATVRFEPVDEGGGPAFTRTAFRQDRAISFADLPEGTFRLRFDAVSGEIRGKGSGSDANPAHRYRFRHQILDPDVVVELVDDETKSRTVDLHEGAALRLTCHDVDGNPLAADCRLTDAAGKEVAFVLVKSPPLVLLDLMNGGAIFDAGPRTYGGRKLDGDTPCRTDPALKPGRYVLTVQREGYDRAELPFELVAGEVHDFDVVLTRKP